jgi:hypothetical protein
MGRTLERQPNLKGSVMQNSRGRIVTCFELLFGRVYAVGGAKWPVQWWLHGHGAGEPN